MVLRIPFVLNFIVIGRVGLTQSVEHLTVEGEVAGSIPGGGVRFQGLKITEK